MNYQFPSSIINPNPNPPIPISNPPIPISNPPIPISNPPIPISNPPIPISNPPIPVSNPNRNPNSSYFAQQAIRAGYVAGDARQYGDDVRRREFDGYVAGGGSDVRRRDYDGLTVSGGRREYEGYRGSGEMKANPVGVRGSVEWEMEKERIRKEIIAEEMTRRRILEDEVRREMRFERGGSSSYYRGGFQTMSYSLDHSTRGSWSGSGSGFKEEQDVIYLGGFETMTLNQAHPATGSGSGLTLREIKEERDVGYRGGFETMPLNRDHPVRGNGSGSGSGLALREIKEERDVGYRGGFETMPFYGDRGYHPVFPGSGRGIGYKEVNSVIDPLPEAKPSAHPAYLKRKTMAPPVGSATEYYKKRKTKKDWSCSLCGVTTTNEESLNAHLQGKKHQAREMGTSAHKTVIGTGPPKTISTDTVKPLAILNTPAPPTLKEVVHKNQTLSKLKGTSVSRKREGEAKSGAVAKHTKKSAFFCEMCQVGANSMIMFDAHKKGQKHLANLSMLNVTDKTAQGEASSQNTSVVDKNRTLSKLKGTSIGETSKVEVKAGTTAKPNKKFQFFCEMCQIGANAMVVFDAHKKGKKHLANLSKLNIVDETAQVEASSQNTFAVKKKHTLSKSKVPSVKKKMKGVAKAGVTPKTKKEFPFFCEMCQVGANCMVVFEGHMKGKKHLAKLSGLNKTDETAQVEASPEKAVTEENKEVAARESQIREENEEVAAAESQIIEENEEVAAGETNADGDASKVEDAVQVFEVEGCETLSTETVDPISVCN